MRCLAMRAAHGPAGAWIGAGYERNAVWDHISVPDTEVLPPADPDVNSLGTVCFNQSLFKIYELTFLS